MQLGMGAQPGFTPHTGMKAKSGFMGTQPAGFIPHAGMGTQPGFTSPTRTESHNRIDLFIPPLQRMSLIGTLLTPPPQQTTTVLPNQTYRPLSLFESEVASFRSSQVSIIIVLNQCCNQAISHKIFYGMSSDNV